MNLIDISQFIREHVVKRRQSMFADDVERSRDRLITEIQGKSVLVVGAAGTIGKSYTKALLDFEPGKLVVVDTNENGLTELTRDLRSTADQFVPKEYISYPMNFGEAAFKKMFAEHAPFDIIANFAAHKHVRSEKDKYSVEAMLENNVFKARDFLDLVIKTPPSHFFCVSTDKAANPVNVMGASKKLMEETIMAYSQSIPITTARFANVAFSNGSLLDGYVQRLMKNQALSCPSDVRRFFVSPEESGQICLLACVLGESSEIFFPKLDEEELISFKQITEDFFLAMGREMIVCNSEEEAKQLSVNLGSSDPYPVYFFESDTSGEKQFEEFYTECDKVNFAKFSALGVIENANKPSLERVQRTIEELRAVMNSDNYDKAAIVAVLEELIPDFGHIETGKNLDQKM
ncbi:MAG: SDR family NAD(P)-dependent oxidoreductase [Pseudomonadota bacterium]